MSDETSGKSQGGGDGKGTDAPRPSLSVRAQYVKDLSFENPSTPDSLAAGDAPTINISVQVEGRQLDDGAHEVELRINAEAKRGENVVFLTELNYAGVFVVANVPPEHLQSVVMHRWRSGGYFPARSPGDVRRCVAYGRQRAG